MAIKYVKKTMAIAVVGMGTAAFAGIAGAETASPDAYNRAEIARQNYQALHGNGEFLLSGSDPEYAESVVTGRSDMDLFTFDAADNMELINQPLLMVAGICKSNYG